MKKLKQIGSDLTINIVEHWMTQNFWEYYITDAVHDDDIVTALVLGYEDEIGYISLSEISPFVISKTKCLDDVIPPPGWNWGEV